jgi:N-dimethylarginine dimethylaminohydrolase
MKLTPAGSDPPATLGGPGWQPRLQAHADEVRDGRIWSACGYRSEVAVLRQVLLAWPPDRMADIGDPARWLMNERVDLAALRDQTTKVRDAFLAAGVDVLLDTATIDAPPNVIFMRDLCLVTPHGAIVARAASAQRAGEERYAAAALARAGIPILATVTGTATFEGADALWLDPGTVMLGVGRRTNAAGAAAVTRLLGDQGVRVLPVPLSPQVQHLLGAVAFLDEGLAAVYAAAAPDELRRLLASRGYRVIELPASPDLVRRRGMNLVTLAPGRVLMPSRCPAIRRDLEAAGVETRDVEVGEYVKAAGALGCLTAIVRRDT